MRIGAQFPVISSGTSSQATVDRTASARQATALPATISAPSSQHQFESLSTDGAKFTRIESLDRFTQFALDSYQQTQALSSDHPRYGLIGVDVYA